MSHLTFPLKPKYKIQMKDEFLKLYFEEFLSDRLMHGHWSAGHRNGNFSDYHVITLQEEDGTVHHVFNCDVMKDMFAHTSGRNTNSIGLAIACMAGGGYENFGPEPPSPAQIKAHVQLVATICCNHRIPFGNFGTHGERADMLDYILQGKDPYDPDNLGAPPYGPIYGGKGNEHGYPTDEYPQYNRPVDVCCRWDLCVGIDPNTLVVYPFASIAQNPHFEFFPDWFRGNVALEVQRMTASHWQHNTTPITPADVQDRTHGEDRPAT